MYTPVLCMLCFTAGIHDIKWCSWWCMWCNACNWVYCFLIHKDFNLLQTNTNFPWSNIIIEHVTLFWALLVARRLIVQCFHHEACPEPSATKLPLTHHQVCSWWRPLWSRSPTSNLLLSLLREVHKYLERKCATLAWASTTSATTSYNSVYVCIHSYQGNHMFRHSFHGAGAII